MDDEEFEDDAKKPAKGTLSDRTKGIIVGAAGAIALGGIIYAIVKEESKPTHSAHAVPEPPGPLDQDLFAETYPAVDAAEVDVTATTDEDGGVKITEVMKDVSTVGMAVRGISALEPVAELLIGLI